MYILKNFMFDFYKQHFFMCDFFFQKIEKLPSEGQQQTEVICSL